MLWRSAAVTGFSLIFPCATRCAYRSMGLPAGDSIAITLPCRVTSSASPFSTRAKTALGLYENSRTEMVLIPRPPHSRQVVRTYPWGYLHPAATAAFHMALLLRAV